MNVGKKLLIAFVVAIVLVVLALSISHSTYFKVWTKSAFSQAKITLGKPAEISQEEQQGQNETYARYSQGKDDNVIYVEFLDEKGSNYDVEINDEKFPWGKSFSLDEKILIRIKDLDNNEVKEKDITDYFKAGDILRFTYEDSFLYLFIQTFQNGGFENNWMRIKI